MRLLILALAVLAALPAGPARGASPDYFPLTAGTEWVYRTSTGHDLILRASGTAQVGEIACQILESMVSGVVTQRECYRREGGTLFVHVRIYPGGEIALTPPQPILVLPPALGRAWSWNGKAGATPARVSLQWAKMEQVTTAAGTFTAAQLYLEGVVGEERVQSWRWFAPGVGMVREDSIASSDGGSVRIVAELREFRPVRR